jgi:hypothetical protein
MKINKQQIGASKKPNIGEKEMFLSWPQKNGADQQRRHSTKITTLSFR